MDDNIFKVGAGRAVINYTQDMFPNFRERYTHVHDDSYVQVLIIERERRYALAVCGTVIVSVTEEIKEELSKLLNVPHENIVVAAKHVLSSPHSGRAGAEKFLSRAEKAGMPISMEEAEEYARRDSLLSQALIDAAVQAAGAALAGLAPAYMGVGFGYSEVNVNRVVRTANGWWQGCNPSGITDRTVPVLRFDSMDGRPIAVLFACNTAPGVLENSYLSDGRRAVSGDMAAAAERYIDSVLSGAVAIYAAGATADQWTSLRAMLDTMDDKLNQTVTDLHENGFVLAEILGKRLGEQVVKTASAIRTSDVSGPVSLHSFLMNYPGQKVSVPASAGAATECGYAPDGERSSGIYILRLGGTAVVFCGVEIGVRTYGLIKDASPFENTIVVEFANSRGSGSGYMAERDMYEMMTYQSRKSSFAAGSAEKFTDDVIAALKRVYSEE